MQRSRTFDVTAGANALGTEKLTVPNDRRYIVRRFAVEKVNADTDLAGFVEQDQLVDVSGEALFDLDGPWDQEIPLKPGDEFAIGWQNNTGGGITQKITVMFDDMPAGV